MARVMVGLVDRFEDVEGVFDSIQTADGLTTGIKRLVPALHSDIVSIHYHADEEGVSEISLVVISLDKKAVQDVIDNHKEYIVKQGFDFAGLGEKLPQHMFEVIVL